MLGLYESISALAAKVNRLCCAVKELQDNPAKTIYTDDSSLTGDRTVSGDGFDLYLDAQTNIGGTSIDDSAQLQVDSTTKGFLMPRMNLAQRLALVSPAIGLLVYQTDTTEGVYQYTSAGWTLIGSGGGGGGASALFNFYNFT
jgi:hypothetical protein